MDLKSLPASPLFQGIAPEELPAMLSCLGAYPRRYPKDATVFSIGDSTQHMGLVLSGRVIIENDDIWGTKAILDNVLPGQVFAETYASLPNEPLMVNAVAAEESEILFLNAGKVLQTCPHSCSHHARLVRNLLAVSARKNLALSRRIFYTSSKTIRGRLLAYLSDQAVREGTVSFTIPFDRQQLADYLGVDRSALSNELSKMQRDGLLTVKKNVFQLKQLTE